MFTPVLYFVRDLTNQILVYVTVHLPKDTYSAFGKRLMMRVKSEILLEDKFILLTYVNLSYGGRSSNTVFYIEKDIKGNDIARTLLILISYDGTYN